MRGELNRKGIARIFEALLALSVVLPFIIIVQTFHPQVATHDPELLSIEATTLTSLDESGLLPQLLANKDWVRLEAAIKAMLPPGVTYTLEISKFTAGGGLSKLTTVGGGGEMQYRASIAYVVNVYEDGDFTAYYLTLTLSKG